jgi:uncharacterized protein YjiS (DUF1127 family)
MLDRLARVDAPDEVALLATTTVRGTEVAVGEARYARDGLGIDARSSHSSSSNRQRLGVGTRLLRELMRQAARSRSASLYGQFENNAPMLALRVSSIRTATPSVRCAVWFAGLDTRPFGQQGTHGGAARICRRSTHLTWSNSDMNAHSNVIAIAKRGDVAKQSESPWSLACTTVAQWLQRARDRRELADLSARQRRDIGLTLDAIEAEVRKPFWRA